ncbi:MAG TPA: hypothetical protein VFZ09_21570 [Archangium sp.]|uniref:hypothetical protein n=1 Tax=Archangium sp. TaxID=1872627 RepID=UPI002E3668DF|nr:hypothetical protein [Archangium sp.]HEX5748844.1 hypothetical protein [Archangium sp.]
MAIRRWQGWVVAALGLAVAACGGGAGTGGDGTHCAAPPAERLSHPEEDTAHRDAGAPSVAVDGAGNVLVVFGAGGEVWARRYVLAEARWEPLVRLDVGGLRAWTHPLVAADASGHALAAWATPAQGLAVAHFRPGTGWQAPQFLLNEGELPDTRLTGVALDAGGHAAVAFAAFNTLSARFDHFVQLLRPDGDPRAELPMGTSANPEAALALHGSEERLDVALVWLGSVGRTLVTRGSWWFPRDSMVIQDAEVLQAELDGDVRGPRAAYDGTGRLHAAWARQLVSSDALILEHQWTGPDGRWQSAPVRLGVLAGRDDWALATDGSASFVWVEDGGARLWASTLTDGGWSAAEPVAGSPAPARTPTAALDARGALRVVWSAPVQGMPALHRTVREAEGWSTPTVAHAGTDEAHTTPVLRALPARGEALVWLRQRGGVHAVLGALPP